MTFDINKPVQTRDRRPARIVDQNFCPTDYRQGFLLAIIGRHGEEATIKCYPSGRVSSSVETDDDLINVPDKRVLEGWVNVYQGGALQFALFTTRESADLSAGSSRIACVHVRQEYEVGS